MREKILFFLVDKISQLACVGLSGIQEHADVVLESEEAHTLGQPFSGLLKLGQMDTRGDIILLAGRNDFFKGFGHPGVSKSYHAPGSESS